MTSVTVRMLNGDTIVRLSKFMPDGTSTYHLAPKDIKQRLRGNGLTGPVIAACGTGSIDWSSDQGG